ncbi:Josephin-domain-containing protein [Cyathus striatus]|nr:Josephin-domain-containing protein [Cyathus striatus]
MSNLEHLKSIIYHEKQEPGSMLCAQHALNSLLQGNYFTAPDLSHIAQDLDDLEDSYHDDEIASGSRNMDDTGFFSQVLERGLSVWGLSLVRWRSEQMRPFQNYPHTQLAFILNLEQHWFTLRRFGPATSDISLDSGEGQWFNLNSFLEAPQWVSKTYLGMVLQQAEVEGYSVFAVTQANPTAPLGLPRTHADEVATFPEPDYVEPPNVEATLSRVSGPQDASSSQHHSMDHIEGIEDEDYELQAALQASLLGNTHDSALLSDQPSSAPPRLARALIPLPSDTDTLPTTHPQSGTHTPTLPTVTSSGGLNIPGHADIDPVEASRERNLVMLRRMREQQELAQRELFHDPEDAAAFERRREERQRQEEQEEEDLRRAIAESEALIRNGSGSRGRVGDEDKDFEMSNTWSDMPSGVSGARVYDDEDAELQAALKASLEGVTEGYQHSPSSRKSTFQSTAPTASNEPNLTDDTHETESILSDSTATDGPSETVTNEEPSIDEIRRARLARFGM